MERKFTYDKATSTGTLDYGNGHRITLRGSCEWARRYADGLAQEFAENYQRDIHNGISELRAQERFGLVHRMECRGMLHEAVKCSG